MAKNNNIELYPNEPFTKYKNDEECPKGFFLGRTYPKYLDHSSSKITESLMSIDLSKFLNNKVTIIDTKAENNQRPNTSTTAHDAAIDLVKKIKNGDFGDQKEFIILLETNNPYIERQIIDTQRAVDKVLKDLELDKQGYKIVVEGVGFANKQDTIAIHSELPALLAEKYKADSNDKYKIEDLLYQTRPNNETLDSTLPLIGDVHLTIFDRVQAIFDNYLD
ncbi:MAG: hypothetical protein LN588_02910 [Rickettsia endosymbiont of Bryobia graminum]|nr:hypothetical protein [Rickettsia endosymbiont of Bryobia graminum]